MAIEFTCPACGGALRVRDGAVGRVVRCGGCMTLLRVPEAEPTPSPPPAFADAEPETPRPSPRPAARPAPAAPPESDFPDPADSPLQPVRGTRFWLTVTAATLMLGACGCCGLAALVLPDPQWQTYESRGGGFRVDLPAEPRDDVRPPLPLQQAKAVEGTHLWTRAENYVVAYWDRPGGFRRSDDEVLDGQVKTLTGARDVRRVIRADAIQVGGFAAREFEYQTRNGGTYTARVILAEARVYLLLAGGRFSQPDNENVRRFLDSFEFTDPQLVAGGRRRGDLAALGLEQLQQRQARQRLRDAGAAAAAAALAAAEAERGRGP